MVADQVKAMEKDLQRSIIKAVGIGEARMKKVEERALENADAVTRSLQAEITEQVRQWLIMCLRPCLRTVARSLITTWPSRPTLAPWLVTSSPLWLPCPPSTPSLLRVCPLAWVRCHLSSAASLSRSRLLTPRPTVL